jgi:hypothetical protein
MISAFLLAGVVLGHATISTPQCTVAGSAYNRDEGVPGHLRQRVVIYAAGCDFTGLTHYEGSTRAYFTSAGQFTFDLWSKGKGIIVNFSPGDIALREAYSLRRGTRDYEERGRTVDVFLVIGRLEIIVEDDTFPPPPPLEDKE